MNNHSTSIRRVSFLPHDKAIFQETFWPFGEMLLLKTNNLGLIEAAEAAFGRFPNIDQSSAEPIVITIFVKEGDRRSGFPTHTEPSHHTAAHHFIISLDKDNVAVADLRSGTASGFLTPEVIENRDFVRYYFVEALFQALMTTSRNYISIHAACIQKNGVSLILQGKSGSGKSTLAFACLRNHYQLLAEDVVHIKFGDNEIELRGAPWKFHLLPDTIRFFPEIENVKPKIQINGELKLEIEIEEYYPGSAITSAPPGPILLVTRNPSKSAAIERLSPEIAIREFEVVWPWEIGWSSKHEIAAKRLLQNGVYRLYTGNDIFESMHLIDELLENIETTDRRDLPYATHIYPEMPGASTNTP